MGQYDLSLGVLLVGIFFNTYLFGIVTVQFATYYNCGFKDPWWIKLSVAFLLAIDVFHSAAVIYMAWGYYVTNFNNPAMIAVALWPYSFTPIGTGLAAIITHVFLSYRIYRLRGHLWLFVVFIIGALVSFSTAVACGTRAWVIKDMTKLSALTPLVTWWLVIQMVLDMTIACVMAYVLWSSKTGYRQTDNVIHRLVRGAIQTGVFSTIFAAGDLIFFAVLPDTQLYGMFAIPLGRIYTNTLIHTLNMRGSLKEILAETVGLTAPSSFGNTKGIQIHVHGTITTQVDEVGDVRGEDNSHCPSDAGAKVAVRETHPTTPEAVFADMKPRVV